MLDRGAIMGNLGLGIDGGVPRTTTRQGLREVPRARGRAASRGMPASLGLTPPGQRLHGLDADDSRDLGESAARSRTEYRLTAATSGRRK